MTRTRPARPGTAAAQRPQLGLSLIELMISITLGMLIMAALLTLFVNVTRTNNEMTKANRQIENGRFAIQVLQSDIVHAGFWGELDYTSIPAPSFAVPTAIPAPCVVSGWASADKDNLLSIPVQGYANGNTLKACGVSGVLTNSDVLVVRHANTCTAGSACDGGSDTGPHIQVSNCRDTPLEATYVIDSPTFSPRVFPLSAFPLRNKGCATTPVAAQRKVMSNIYYLATSNGQPTLMRVSLVNGAYTTPQPLIEGIEAFKVQYGIDSSIPGDGSPDSYVTSEDLAVAEAAVPQNLGLHLNIVAVKIHVLARNLEPSPGYTDTKTYTLGNAASASICSTDGTCTNKVLNPDFKRHVFSTTIRLVNPSARREKP